MSPPDSVHDNRREASGAAAPFTVILGVAQDAGYPQAGCDAACCTEAWRDAGARRGVACLAIVDPATGERWIIDATPDFREQLRALDRVAPPDRTPGLAGIALTHGHVGHYTGLTMLGHEAIGADGVPLFVMPRMRSFLTENGPWDQLVRGGNVELRPMTAGRPVALNERISITPLPVPHREEYTETVGFRIVGPRRKALFIPDIDAWERWERRIEDEIAAVDVAYLDGTFFSDGEIPGRDMTAIPHPFIVETMRRLETRPARDRAKVRFIHLNHTNPALRPGSDAFRAIEAAGFGVAQEGERVELGSAG